MSDVEVLYQATPNPESMKFTITKTICDEVVSFSEPLEATRSPLASKIFGFPWASAVMIGPNFVTVTKQDWVDWGILADPLSHLIKEHIESNEPILLEPTLNSNEDFNEDDSAIVKKIKTILNNEIRPAVALDGGDIMFHKYERNILYVEMHGACNGCPSATMTLKQGVQARMQAALPEIKDVIAIN